MPNTRSAKKSHRKSEVRRLRNRARRSMLRTELKKFLKAIETGDAETVGPAWKAVVTTLDRESARGLLHANTAARTKSRLAKRIPADLWKQIHAK